MTADEKLQTGLMICSEVHRWKDTVEQATVAESLGYDSVWIPEHHFLEAGYGPAPLAALAGLASVTERVRLGTAVLLPAFYHPVRLAEETAFLHTLSGGRFICGLGLGYRREEFRAFGVTYEKRRHYLEDSIEILRRLWTNTDVTYHGAVLSVEDLTITPRLRTAPEIWYGGWMAPALDRAARLSDAWFPGPTADATKLRSAWDIYDSRLQEHGRSPTARPLIREMWVGRNRSEVDYGRRLIMEMYEGDYRKWGQENVGEGDPLQGRALVGTPDEVVEAVMKWRNDFPFDHLIGRMHLHGVEQEAVLRSMELFADHVRPQLG